MKAGFLIFTSLFLAVLCLGSASTAMAQSVTGGGTLNFGSNPPVTIEVAARSEPAGIVRISEGGMFILSDVVDLCVVDNEAGIVAQVTHADPTAMFSPGSFVLFCFQDNGNTGDIVNIAPVTNPSGISCATIIPILPACLAGGTPLTRGNITVNP